MAYRWLGALLVLAVCTAGCGSTGTGGPRGEGGTGGVGGGTGGAGGAAGSGGTAGAGGSQTQCLTSVLCASCPTEGFCDTSQDCSVGFVCIESGCDTLDGAAIKQCVFGTGGACTSDAMCPVERQCVDVPGEEGKRCVKTTPGCNSDFDCILGFTCESGSCVDRRVPCGTDVDCPKSHFCANGSNGKFCVRVHRACQNEFDCVGIAPSCADIDGDGSKECAGVKDANVSLVACVNSACTDAAAPVCEVSGVWSNTECGQYGLCRTAGDCVAGFECVSLWPDGHKECVPNGGSCSSFTECPVQQVCASPRDGGAPSCQAGFQP